MPTKLCDICLQALGKTYVDGKTKMGPWAYMCERCYKVHGVGLGTGLGQRYDTATSIKLEG
jgi:hypothetical protein